MPIGSHPAAGLHNGANVIIFYFQQDKQYYSDCYIEIF